MQNRGYLSGVYIKTTRTEGAPQFAAKLSDMAVNCGLKIGLKEHKDWDIIFFPSFALLEAKKILPLALLVSEGFKQGFIYAASFQSKDVSLEQESVFHLCQDLGIECEVVDGSLFVLMTDIGVVLKLISFTFTFFLVFDETNVESVLKECRQDGLREGFLEKLEEAIEKDRAYFSESEDRGLFVPLHQKKIVDYFDDNLNKMKEMIEKLSRERVELEKLQKKHNKTQKDLIKMLNKDFSKFNNIGGPVFYR